MDGCPFVRGQEFRQRTHFLRRAPFITLAEVWRVRSLRLVGLDCQAVYSGDIALDRVLLQRNERKISENVERSADRSLQDRALTVTYTAIP